MDPAIYLLLASLLMAFAYFVFRQIVGRSYLNHGHLTLGTSLLQLLVFACYFLFPLSFNPPEWSFFWQYSGENLPFLHYIGLILICAGFVVAFGTMGWFGMRKAFGLKEEGLTRTGPYKISRNPQILGGYLLVLGTFMQWPSFYALGWAMIWVVIAHWMVVTEEEHLAQLFGEEYKAYCAEVPRYVIRPSKTKD